MNQTFRFSSDSILWIMLFIFVTMTRFYQLGVKPMHHDESLYAHEMYEYYCGEGYAFDPMTLGPLIFHAQLPILFLFGVSDATIRTLPALTGVVLILALFRMRNYLPGHAALLAGWLYATNPVIMFFQRFLRQDAPYLICSLLAFFCLYLWLNGRKHGMFYAFIFFTSAACCIKFEAYMLALAGLMFCAIAAWAQMEENSVNQRAIVKLCRQSPAISLLSLIIFLFFVEFLFFVVMDRYQFMRDPAQLKLYWFASFLINLSVVILIVLRNKKKTPEQEQPDNNYMMFVKAVTMGFGIWLLSYSSFFFNFRDGVRGGVYGWFLYWKHMEIYRTCDPFSHHFLNLIVFAFLPFSIVAIGFFIKALKWLSFRVMVIFSFGWGALLFVAVTSKTNWHLTNERVFSNFDLAVTAGCFVLAIMTVYKRMQSNDFLRGFLLWWSVIVFLFYSIFPQKTPWLMMPILTPVILLASIDLSDLYRWIRHRSFKTILTIIIGILFAGTFHQAILINFHDPADPVWQINYVHTTKDIARIVEELNRLAYVTNLGPNLPVLVNGHAVWPLIWYLRDWKQVAYSAVSDNPDRYMAIIANGEDENSIREVLGARYVARKYYLRDYYLPGFHDLTPGRRWREAWRWFLLGEKFNSQLHGGQEIVLFLRNDLDLYQ